MHAAEPASKWLHSSFGNDGRSTRCCFPSTPPPTPELWEPPALTPPKRYSDHIWAVFGETSCLLWQTVLKRTLGLQCLPVQRLMQAPASILAASRGIKPEASSAEARSELTAHQKFQVRDKQNECSGLRCELTCCCRRSSSSACWRASSASRRACSCKPVLVMIEDQAQM